MCNVPGQLASVVGWYTAFVFPGLCVRKLRIWRFGMFALQLLEDAKKNSDHLPPWLRYGYWWRGVDAWSDNYYNGGQERFETRRMRVLQNKWTMVSIDWHSICSIMFHHIILRSTDLQWFPHTFRFNISARLYHLMVVQSTHGILCLHSTQNGTEETINPIKGKKYVTLQWCWNSHCCDLVRCHRSSPQLLQPLLFAFRSPLTRCHVRSPSCISHS